MHWILSLYIFTTYQGHGLDLDSYRDRIVYDGGWQTEAECLAVGAKLQEGFKSTVDWSEHSRDLLAYQCDLAPAQSTSKPDPTSPERR